MKNNASYDTSVVPSLRASMLPRTSVDRLPILSGEAEPKSEPAWLLWGGSQAGPRLTIPRKPRGTFIFRSGCVGELRDGEADAYA